MIGQRLPVTAELILITQLMALLLAMPAGVLAAYRARSGIDHALGALSIALLSNSWLRHRHWPDLLAVGIGRPVSGVRL